MIKKLSVLILGFIMAGFILAGCGNGGAPAAPAPAPAPAPAGGGTAEAAAPAADVDEIVDLDLFITHMWYIDRFEGLIPDLIRDATGVHLDITIATDPGQLGVMIAAGDLPDMIWTDSELDRLSTRHLTMSFTEMAENYGANWDDLCPERIAIARFLSDDGDFYTILNHFSSSAEWAGLQMGAPGQPAIFYRRDLLDAIGIDGNTITSTDRLMEVLLEVRDAYPDRVPFGLAGFWKFQGIGGAFGIEGARFNQNTGEYSYVATTPVYREFLRFANMMHRNGLITAEHYANENEAVSEQAAFNDQVVFHNGFLSYGDFVHLYTQTRNVHPDAEWAILPFMGTEFVGFGRGWSGAFVSRNVSDPYAAARLLTFLHSNDGRRASIWGREGIDFTLSAGGVPIFSDEFMQARSDGTLMDIWNWRFNFGSTAVEELYLNTSGLNPDIMAIINTHGANVRTLPEVSIALPPSASAEGVLRERLEELRRVHEAAIIFTDSDAEFDDAFEVFMHALEQTGVEQYNDFMTNRIREVREQLGW